MPSLSKYRIADQISNDNQPDFLLRQLLHNRGLVDEEEIKDFLNPDYENGRHNPFLLHDMEEAVARILRATASGERVAIFSDYDCDGIPGAVVLHDFFKAIGHDNFTNYIPHRHFEGFGLNTKALDKLKEDGVTLVITIDCGTSDNEAVEHANKIGLDIIITDHHEPGDKLPNAVAVVNPKIGKDYPFSELCGAGVVFKLVEALIERGEFDIKAGQEKWWLDMVGLATVSDMVPLIGENRIFAHYGLRVLRKSRRPGLQHLLRKARSNQYYLTEDDIGFTIGPRINAASRMDTPEDAFNLLSTKDEDQAGATVSHLEKLNNERKGIVSGMTKELKKRLNEMSELPSVLVLGNPNWRPALVGLAANSLSSTYDRPVFLWGRDGNQMIKGSCRSEGRTSVIKLMESTAELFLEYGGHHGSGGFSVKEETVFHLSEKLNEAFLQLGKSAEENVVLKVDAKLNLTDVNEGLLKTLRALSPFGVGNEKPLFMFERVTPKSVEQFGKTKEHLKLTFESGAGNLEAIAFFSAPENYDIEPKVGEELTLLAHVEESFFMNRRQTRLRIVGIV